jgi:adenosine deaminase
VTPPFLDDLRRSGLAELHTHLGGSVHPAVMWTLAHEQGIALPVKDYWDFENLISIADPRGVDGLPELDAIYKWTELIQSSPLAVERSIHGAIGGAYRRQNITTLEIRFNPMKRNRGGERDLDPIILAAIRGLDRAGLEYPQVRCGLVLMMDRTFTHHQNEVIVEKAISWAPRGIVGVDIAGPRPEPGRYRYRDLAPLVQTARAAQRGDPRRRGGRGRQFAELGESPSRPRRIGHNIPRRDESYVRVLVRLGIVLEICPTSNLLTKALLTSHAPRHAPVRRPERAVHDRHRRPRDDANPPRRRARAAAPHRRAHRG